MTADTFGRERAPKAASRIHRARRRSIKTSFKYPPSLSLSLSSKAGRRRGKAQGPESGFSKESTLSSLISSSSAQSSSELKACRARSTRTRTRSRGRRTRTESTISKATPPPPPPPAARRSPTVSSQHTSPTRPPAELLLWKIRGRDHTASTATSATTQKEVLYSLLSLTSFRLPDRRICKKNGRQPPPPAGGRYFFKIGNEERRRRHRRWRWRRDRGGPRRPHCSVHREEGPAQQGVHRQGAEGPPRAAVGPHRHPVL